MLDVELVETVIHHTKHTVTKTMEKYSIVGSTYIAI